MYKLQRVRNRCTQFATLYDLTAATAGIHKERLLQKTENYDGRSRKRRTDVFFPFPRRSMRVPTCLSPLFPCLSSPRPFLSLFLFFSTVCCVRCVFSLSLSLPKRNGKSLRFIYSGTRFVPSFSFHLIFERCDFLDRSTFEKHDSRWSVNSSLPSLGEKRETEWKQYVSGWWIVVGSFQVSVSDKFDHESICIGRKIYFIYIIIILKIF